MANGTPVVTSNISSLPEVVGDAALTVDPYNIDKIATAIRQILNDGDLRSRLITDGYERVKLFSWQGSVERVHRAYQRALGSLETADAPGKTEQATHAGRTDS
jgi:glycosyltransferase involved in cell wall biosynthesis